MFQLGVVADPIPGHERYQGWLAIPYLDRHGDALTMRFRCLGQHNCRELNHGKYASMYLEPNRVFNVGAIHRADDELHVAEGELDAIILNKVGLHAIAIPGGSGWQPHHRRMVAGFSRVHVWGDPDEAGAKFVSEITRSVRNARGVRMERGEGDVSELYKTGGAEAVLARLVEEV